MVNGRRVRGRRRYQMIDDIKIYGSYDERKAENRKDWRMLGLHFSDSFCSPRHGIDEPPKIVKILGDVLPGVKNMFPELAFEIVARMGESRNAYRVLVGRPEGKRPLGRPRRRWEDNIKMDLREVGYDDRDWINLAQDRDRWLAYVGAAMNLRPGELDLPSSSGIEDGRASHRKLGSNNPTHLAENPRRTIPYPTSQVQMEGTFK
ncbi:hypothetical protein ANN_05110 [Periplaneta americana]|uniref:Uncharacterized protein n=1 Tax=Periplaneta americana TaxID=6978 RepID=A0ABQ8TA62_PERAM|nr:hypothetical protein ANN_05110 [Periplaneta americana]